MESSPVIMKGNYPYFINPLTDGVPSMDPELLSEVTDWVVKAGNFSDCSLIVAPESMGIPLAVPVSLRLGIPYTVVRKKSYGLPGETAFEQRTGYSENRMYINGVKSGDRVVILDDVISTGGTVVSLILALRRIGAEVADVLIPVDKNEGRNTVLRDTGIAVKSLVEVTVSDGKVKCRLC
jgi:adenine phosphoribosyltransferase